MTTAGELIELADTGLVIRVEADAQRPGDEFRTGFGKTARDGIGLRAAPAASRCTRISARTRAAWTPR